MRVAMIGAGYVGLVSGACMADFGHHVICVDKDAAKIAALERGEIPIYEPGLHDLVHSNVKEARLSFATALEEPVAFRRCGVHRRRHAVAARRRACGSFLRLRCGPRDRRGARRIYSRHYQVDRTGRHLAMRSSALSTRSGRTPMSWWCRIRNFCARERLFTISSIPIASWSEPRMSAPRRSWPRSTAAEPQSGAHSLHHPAHR